MSVVRRDKKRVKGWEAEGERGRGIMEKIGVQVTEKGVDVSYRKCLQKVLGVGSDGRKKGWGQGCGQ